MKHSRIYGLIKGAALVLTLSLGMVCPAYAALNSGFYTTTSLLGSGHWVKVKIKESGVHQITDAELRAMGFSDPSKVAVYGYGASLISDYLLNTSHPDDLPAVPVMRYGDKLLFYGEGDVSLSVKKRANENFYATVPQRNYFADYSTYFLTDSRPQLPMATVPLKKEYSADVTESFGMVHVEEELTVPGEVGARMLGEDFSRAGKYTVEFEMPSYDYSLAVDRNRIDLDLEFGMQSNSSNYISLVLPSGETRSLYVGQTGVELYAYLDCTRRYADHPFPSADGKYRITVDAAKLALAYAGVDFLAVTYPRTNRLNGLAQETIMMRNPGSDTRIVLENAPATTMVWDITDRYTPRALEVGVAEALPDDSSEGVEMTPGADEPGIYVTSPGVNGENYLLAFDPAAVHPGVESLGEVAPQNLHGLAAPRMLVIASRPFMEEAERLAEAHRSIEGKDVLVVCQDEIYNEFSSGTPHVMALRRFARMLYDKNPAKFRSVLLFGPASYENRGLTAVEPATFHDTYIPMYQREDIAGSGKTAESYSTDAFVGMLEENSTAFDIGRSRMTVAVSRIPATDINDARACVNKSIDYLQNPPTGDFRNRALLMCDKGDGNGHMADANGVAAVIEAYSPATTVHKAYNTIYPWTNGKAEELNRAASQVLSRGVGYWAYSGHATPRFFGGEQIWSVTRSNEQTYDIQPFVMLSTCLALYYDHRAENIGEAMLYNEHGGAIALVGALRQVYQEHNQKLNLELARQYYSAVKGTTFGEIFMYARNKMVPVSGNPATDSRFYDTIYNTLSYNLIGDPELAPGMPTQRVAVTAINGQELPVADEIEIESGRPVTISGVVYNSMDEADADFNGTVSLSLFDGSKSVNVINVDATSSRDSVVVLNEDVLVEAKAIVKEGRFEAKFFVPVPMRAEGLNRLTLYAQDSTDPLRQASGVHSNFNVVDKNMAGGVDDSTLPEITAMYLDMPDFRDGDIFSAEPTLFLEVGANPYGVVGYSPHIGQSLMLFLDGKQAYSTASGSFRSNVEGGGTLEYKLTDLSDGNHELTVRVANNAGQMSTRTIRFTMVNVHSTSTILVDEEQTGSDVLLELDNWEYDAPQARIIVKDAAGQTVSVIPSATFPYRWDMRDNSGNDVPEGVYSVEAYLNGGGHYGSARSSRFIILRN